MSVLRYYKVIQDWELPTDNEVLNAISIAKDSEMLYQYLQCILAPVRNRDKWTILHPKVRLMRWE